MRYGKKCTVTIYKKGSKSNFEIIYPVRKNGVRLDRHTRITGPYFVFSSSRNTAINEIKTALYLDEVKRKHIDLDNRV